MDIEELKKNQSELLENIVKEFKYLNTYLTIKGIAQYTDVQHCSISAFIKRCEESPNTLTINTITKYVQCLRKAKQGLIDEVIK